VGRKAHLEDRKMQEIIQLSAATIFRALNASDEEFSLERKAELASKFIVKRIPSIDAEENLNGNKILVYVAGSARDKEQILSALSPTENKRIECEI
jgi:hypothetical protein